MKWKIPLFKIYWDREDIESVTEIIKRGNYWATGPEIKKFEGKIAEYIGTKYAVAFNSGTSALHAAMIAHGIKKGDEIIIPSFTFIATANTPLFVGAKPIFADIEQNNLGLDPDDIINKITSKTKAIIPVHYGGLPCKIKEISEIAEDHGLILIEDAAEAFGAKVNGKMVGTFGESAMLSFCQNKIITTGEGGCIVTDSKKRYAKLKFIRSHGRQELNDYFFSNEHMDYVDLGYNLRMSNVTAALGLSQLKKVEFIIKKRREKAKYFNSKLKKIPYILQVPEISDTYHHVYQMYTIQVDPKLRDDLIKHLARDGIMSKVYFHPVHHTYYYRKILGYKCDLPATEKISKQVLSLPIYPDLIKDEIDMIINSIKNFEGK